MIMTDYKPSNEDRFLARGAHVTAGDFGAAVFTIKQRKSLGLGP
jgi:hypothetical protein